jgi:16S rRNA (uracil1498-N3)-methyltransferase
VSAPQFFVASLEAPEVLLTEADTRHALRSLRLHPGDEVTVADGRGAMARGRLGRQERGQAVVTVEELGRVARRAPAVSVALAPPKGHRLTWAVQKLAEMGVDEVALIESERSVRAWNPDRAGRAMDRLRSVAREAAMQARRPFVAEVRLGGSLGEALDSATGRAVMLWEESAVPLPATLPEETERVRIVVGPEGGFSEDEAGAARDRGVPLASLGEGVLRTETAAIVGAALVLAHYGRLG